MVSNCCCLVPTRRLGVLISFLGEQLALVSTRVRTYVSISYIVIYLRRFWNLKDFCRIYSNTYVSCCKYFFLPHARIILNSCIMRVFKFLYLKFDIQEGRVHKAPFGKFSPKIAKSTSPISTFTWTYLSKMPPIKFYIF